MLILRLKGKENVISNNINLENPSNFNSIHADIIIINSKNGLDVNFKFLMKGLNLTVPVILSEIKQIIKLKVNFVKYRRLLSIKLKLSMSKNNQVLLRIFLFILILILFLIIVIVS